MALNVKHLKAHELCYEISIRGREPENTVTKNRTTLLGLLTQELGGRSLREVENENDFEEDVTGLKQSLEDLEIKIGEFKGITADEEYKRFVTRLTHVSGRIRRMNIAEGDEVEEQKRVKLELEGRLIALESQLEEKVNPFPIPRHSSTPNKASEQQFNGVKSVPVYKWGITKFSGRGCLVTFLELVESLRVSRGCSTEELFASAGDLLEGHAWTWWHNHHVNRRFVTWEALVIGLKNTFLQDNYDRSLMDEIRSRKQGIREPVSIYISSMEALHLRLTKKPEESEMVENIRGNLLPDYTKLLALQDVSSISQLTSLCRRIESTLRVTPPSRANHQPPLGRPFTHSYQQQNSSAISTSITCWNCGVSGHSYPFCSRRRNLFCYGCGKKGFLKAKCPNCSKKDMGFGNHPQDAVVNPSQNASIQRNRQSVRK